MDSNTNLKSFSIKYFGEIEGRLGVGTKKIFNFDPLVEEERRPCGGVLDERKMLRSRITSSWNSSVKSSNVKSKVNKVSINSELSDVLSQEITSGKNLQYKCNNIKEETIKRPYSNFSRANKLPYVYIKMKDKPKVLSSSELISNRYLKPKINIEEILINHNTNLRKEYNRYYVQDYHLKKSLQVNKKLYSSPRIVESPFRSIARINNDNDYLFYL